MWTKRELEARISELKARIAEALHEAQWFHANAEAIRENDPNMSTAAAEKAQQFVDLHNLLVSELDGYQKSLLAMTK